jgi:hypothetical protein
MREWEWARQADLLPNPTRRDRGGWDFTVQLPRVSDREVATERNIESLDQLPLSATCFIQVKARDGRKPPSVALTNSRIASPIPPRSRCGRAAPRLFLPLRLLTA